MHHIEMARPQQQVLICLLAPTDVTALIQAKTV